MVAAEGGRVGGNGRWCARGCCSDVPLKPRAEFTPQAALSNAPAAMGNRAKAKSLIPSVLLWKQKVTCTAVVSHLQQPSLSQKWMGEAAKHELLSSVV